MAKVFLPTLPIKSKWNTGEYIQLYLLLKQIPPELFSPD
jgi:hypothetical protein